MPDDAAIEKAHMLEALGMWILASCKVLRNIYCFDINSIYIGMSGATVERVRPVSITHPDHFVNIARRRAQQEVDKGDHGAMFADQFENTANFRAHLQTGTMLTMKCI